MHILNVWNGPLHSVTNQPTDIILYRVSIDTNNVDYKTFKVILGAAGQLVNLPSPVRAGGVGRAGEGAVLHGLHICHLRQQRALHPLVLNLARLQNTKSVAIRGMLVLLNDKENTGVHSWSVILHQSPPTPSSALQGQSQI